MKQYELYENAITQILDALDELDQKLLKLDDESYNKYKETKSIYFDGRASGYFASHRLLKETITELRNKLPWED